MNAPVHVAEAYVPYRFTWDEVLRMSEAGLFERADGRRVELIEGELFEVAPESMPHARAKRWLARRFIEALPADAWEVSIDSPLHLSDASRPEPDLCVWRAALRDADVRGPDVALVVEVSISSLAFDGGAKADLYARHGVPEYWIVQPESGAVRVHLDPTPTGYSSVRTVASEDGALRPQGLPDLAISPADLPRP